MQEEKILELLEEWMNYNNVSNSDKIKYYRYLISNLEEEKEELKLKILKICISSFMIGLGLGFLFLNTSNFEIIMSILFIIIGLLFGIDFPIKNENKYIEYENERKLIKKWYLEEKE